MHGTIGTPTRHMHETCTDHKMTITAPAAPALPIAHKGQSLLGYVRQHLEILEGLRGEGVPYDVLIESFASFGWTVEHAALNNALYRARKARSSEAHARRTQLAPVPSSTRQVPATPVATSYRTHSGSRPVTLTPTKDLKLEDLF